MSKQMKYPPCGQVTDVGGYLWDVRDVRTTKHGFDLLFGSVADTRLGTEKAGLPRLIATRELVGYWETHRLSRDCAIYDLPAGRTTIKRMRRKLGFHLLNDERKFWYARKFDLATLDAHEFARKHNVSVNVMRDRRFRIVGRCARPLGWWRTPETIALLMANMTLKQCGQQLGIGTSHVNRLREQARLLLQEQTHAPQQMEAGLDLAA